MTQASDTSPGGTSRDAVTMEKIVALAKRRGFIFPSSEIYGGIGSTYDYGHYGVLLKTKVKAAWWRAMVQERDEGVAARRGDPAAPADLGGLGAPRELHRPADRLQDLQAALSRRSHRRPRLRAQAV